MRSIRFLLFQLIIFSSAMAEAAGSRQPTTTRVFHVRPHYGPTTSYGGTSMRVVFAPGAYHRVLDTGRPTTGQELRFAFSQYQHYNGAPRQFIRGHLLSSRFGGLPTHENLTPLTSSTNSWHRGFENQLARQLHDLHIGYQAGRYGPEHGIEYTVNVYHNNQAQGLDRIFGELEVTAHLVRVNPATGAITRLNQIF